MEQYIMPLSANRKLKAAKSIDQTAYIYGAIGYGKTTFVQKYLAKRRHTYLNCGNRRWDENDIPAQGIVVLDDLHLLDESRREIVRSIVTMPEVWLIIVSRSPVPAWLMPEYINVGFMIISENDLRLGRKEIAGYLDIISHFPLHKWRYMYSFHHLVIEVWKIRDWYLAFWAFLSYALHVYKGAAAD